MGNLLKTVVGAIILMGIVVVIALIGWLITGKNRLRKGSCGWDPSKKEDSCSICGHEKKCEKEDEPKS